MAASAKSIPNLAPRISIITSTFQVAAYLPRAIASMRAQVFDEFEWIIVDGGSTDGTLDVLRENEDIIDYWISEPDTGIYDAWNKAIGHARGVWILFLGADDYLWTPDVLSRASKILETISPEYRIAYGQVALINYAEEVVEIVGDDWTVAKKRFNSMMSLPHTALFHHRDLFQMRGTFDRKFRIAGDYEFLLRELGDHDAFFMRGFVIAGMSIGGISSSPENSRRILQEMRLATSMHGRAFPGMPWLFSALRLEIRQILWVFFGEKRTRWLLDIGRRILKKSAYWTKV